MKPILAVGLAVALAVSLAGVVGSRSAGEEKAEVAPWIFGQSMSQRRSYVAAAELGGKIYVAGGAVGETGRFLAIFQRFDPQTNSWTTLRRLPHAIRAGAGAALDGKVYVTGGETSGRAGRLCPRRTTRSAPSSSRARSGPSAVAATTACCATSGSTTPPRSAGTPGLACQSRWSSSAPPWRATRSTRSGRARTRSTTRARGSGARGLGRSL